MNLSLLLAQQISVMGIMILFGYLAGKGRFVTLEDSVGISKMVLYITCPCTTLAALQTPFTSEKALGFGIAMVSAVVVNFSLVGLGKLFGILLHLNQTEQASIVYSNCGNLIIPIISYVLGPDYVLYTAAYIVVQSLLVWTHGFSLISGERQYKVGKVLKNPNTIAIGIGVVLFFCNIQIPSLPLSALQRVGDSIGPVSMIVVGIMLGTANLKVVFTEVRTWFVCGLRLIICPLIILFIIWITGATKIVPIAQSVIFISFLAAAAPSASTISQMANMCHKHEVQAGCINMMSVVLCMITMPLMTVIFQYLCM